MTSYDNPNHPHPDSPMGFYGQLRKRENWVNPIDCPIPLQFQFKLTADTFPFKEDPRKEIARILRQEANRIESGQDLTPIRDGFGQVSGWMFTTILDAEGRDVGRHALKPKGAS